MEKQPHPLLILPGNFWLIPIKHDTNITQMHILQQFQQDG